MGRLTIKCASCGHEWMTAASFSLYEQQAVESCPCPHCAAYTLCCQEPNDLVAAPHWHILAKVRSLHSH